MDLEELVDPRADVSREPGSDCTASTVQAAHDATLFTMGRHFATVAGSNQVLAAWSAHCESAPVELKYITER